MTTNPQAHIQINVRARQFHKDKLKRWAEASNTTTSAIILQMIENLPDDPPKFVIPSSL